MRKLNLDDLNVESFSTCDGGAQRGTVVGHEATVFPCDTKDTRFNYTCDESCARTGCNACSGHNCYPTQYLCTNGNHTCAQYCGTQIPEGSCHYDCASDTDCPSYGYETCAPY